MMHDGRQFTSALEPATLPDPRHGDTNAIAAGNPVLHN